MKETKFFFANNNRLNKGYLKPKAANLKENDQSFYRKQYEHILPPMEIMEQYESAYPGTLAKLIEMAEKEQLHRHQMELKTLESHKSAADSGRLSAIVFVTIVCITTVAIALQGYLMLAGTFAAAVFLSIGAGIFLSSRRSSFKKPISRNKP